MRNSFIKSTDKTEYQGVRKMEVVTNGKYHKTYFIYDFVVNKQRYRATGFVDARSAAKGMDLKLIEIGQPPRHILKARI